MRTIKVSIMMSESEYRAHKDAIKEHTELIKGLTGAAHTVTSTNRCPHDYITTSNKVHYNPGGFRYTETFVECLSTRLYRHGRYGEWQEPSL